MHESYCGEWHHHKLAFERSARKLVMQRTSVLGSERAEVHGGACQPLSKGPLTQLMSLPKLLIQQSCKRTNNDMFSETLSWLTVSVHDAPCSFKPLQSWDRWSRLATAGAPVKSVHHQPTNELPY